MNYYINPQALSPFFTIPVSVVDKHFKFAKAEHIKILLYILRNMTEIPEVSAIAEACSVNAFCVEEALLFWADAGILISNDFVEKSASQKKLSSQSKKPTRSDVAKRADDPKIRYLLRETQVKFARPLKSNEAQTLIWLYDDVGLDISLILLIVQYAVAHKKANIRFIEATAVLWAEKGICDIMDAEAELNKMTLSEQAWGVVSRAFGLEKRKPSQKESDYAYLWLNEWKLTPEMLERAYEECVNQKSKFTMPYTAKILESWHQKGYKKPDDIESKPKKSDVKENIAAYDLDEFEKMLTSKD